MNDSKNSEPDSREGILYPAAEWNRKLSALKVSGMRMANQMREQGNAFIVKILTTMVVKEGDTIPLRAVIIKLDWKVATRLEMVESATEMITKAYEIDSLDPALSHVLGSVIEGKGLYEHSIGEFFELYGRFEEKYQLKKGSDTRDKMASLVKGDKKYLKKYKEYKKWSFVPMPYAVRNILAHAGTNPNKLDQQGEEIRTSITLLKSWVN
ncbi:MAG: hypothetical protein OXK78_15765 [Caldilineaceae bacterium]|nr:hypothetical protein [Caldilineaceae bacterium]